MDLTTFGVSKKPKIQAIEFALHREDGKVWEDIGLGTDELDEIEKGLIKKKGSLETIFDIVNQR